MIEKPDWSIAPEWANYLAQDRDGSWHWYQDEPKQDHEQWVLANHCTEWKLYRPIVESKNWKETLERRPV
jgi:hypothetical protein